MCTITSIPINWSGILRIFIDERIGFASGFVDPIITVSTLENVVVASFYKEDIELITPDLFHTYVEMRMPSTALNVYMTWYKVKLNGVRDLVYNIVHYSGL